MALFGSLSTLRAQLGDASRFAPVFAYVDELFRAAPESGRLRNGVLGETIRVELAAGAFALEQAYRTKARPDAFFESHRKYIDVQVVVEGEEWMEVADLSRMTVRTPYNPDRDLIVYEDQPGASVIHLRAGEAAVFYPVDVHMPGLAGPAGGGIVRKTVIKVPVG